MVLVLVDLVRKRELNITGPDSTGQHQQGRNEQ